MDEGKANLFFVYSQLDVNIKYVMGYVSSVNSAILLVRNVFYFRQ